MVVDTMGLVIAAVVHSAALQDRDGAKPALLKAQAKGCTRLQQLWADGGYAGKLLEWVTTVCQWALEIVKRTDDLKGFVRLPKRGVVERTFSWRGIHRRLDRHREYRNETGEALIHLAMIHVMLRRLAGRKRQAP